MYSEKAHTNKSYISRIENDASDIRVSTLIKMVEQGLGGLPVSPSLTAFARRCGCFPAVCKTVFELGAKYPYFKVRFCAVGVIYEIEHPVRFIRLIVAVLISSVAILSLAQSAPEITIVPSEIRFENITICDRDSVHGFITNVGRDTVEIDSIRQEGRPDFLSTLSKLKHSKLGPGDSVWFTVYLNPIEHGIRYAYFFLRSRSGTFISEDTIHLSTVIRYGTRILSVSVDTIDFGTTSFCVQRDSVVTFTNTGCDEVTVDILTYPSNMDGFFVHSSPGGPFFPATILPGESFQFHIETLTRDVSDMLNTVTLTFTGADTLVFVTAIRKFKETKESYDISSQIVPSAGTSGDTVKLELWAADWSQSDSVMDGVTLLQFDLTLNTDMFHFLRTEGPNQVTISGARVNVAGDPHVIAPRGLIASFIYEVHLTKDTAANILLSELDLKSSDGLLCTPQLLGGEGAQFTYRYACGDRAIQKILQGKAIDITSIRPNPARDVVTVEIVSEQTEPVTIEVYDAVGKQLQTISRQPGTAVLPVGGLSAGNYVLRVVNNSGVVSRRFVVER